MRVTDKMGTDHVIANLQKNRGEMSELQNKAATQRRINKPSDDPIASARVLAYRTDERQAAQFLKNINVARSYLEFTDVSLNEMSDVLMRLKELAIQQANDAGASSETRRITAEEVAQTYKQFLQIGNRKLGDRYIFAGNNTTTPPFDSQGNYTGDEGDIKIHINKEAFIPMNLPGSRVVLGKGLGVDGFIRGQDAAPRNAEELENHQKAEQKRQEDNQELEQSKVLIRGPANDSPRGGEAFKSHIYGEGEGIDILQAIKGFEVALQVNDKAEIQQTIENVDKALGQVIHARAQVGARIQALNHTQNSLQQNTLDNKSNASQLEDVDIYTLVNDMSKTDSTLKATMEASPRIVQPSLLDFLK
jgi:flagellar hook-associated protein 3 FlgL